MGRWVEGAWPGDPAGQTRKERMPGRYRAYLPDAIADSEPTLGGALAEQLSRADAAVADLNRGDPQRSAGATALARQLLRHESLASSRIEGLAISHKRIGRAAYDPKSASDEKARAVLANIEAMAESIEFGSRAERFETETVLELHRTLMEGTDPGIAGVMRDSQNWIGGSWRTPVGAEFVPPPHTEVEALMDDLVAFIDRDDMPTIYQAAIVHAQFETIHPFPDGNGRIGRCLIHVVLRRRGLTTLYLPPTSLVMATGTRAYIRALTAYREDRESEWVSYFATTVREATRAAADLETHLATLQESWRAAGGVRRGSTAERLIDLLPAQPVLDVPTASRLAGTSEEAARLAINRLEERKVLQRIGGGKRNRAWEAPELWELLDRFEQGLERSQG